MKNLNRNEWIAVSLGMIFLAYLLFAGPIMSLFNPPVVEDSKSQTPPLPQSGVVTEEVVVGNGLVAESGDALTVHYVGSLPDGKVFDSSLDSNTPFSFTLGVGQVIRGWDEGLAGMQVGGRRLLVIAPDYGYGDEGVGPIPPNSTIIFQVELLNVEKSSSPR